MHIVYNAHTSREQNKRKYGEKHKMWKNCELIKMAPFLYILYSLCHNFKTNLNKRKISFGFE